MKRTILNASRIQRFANNTLLLLVVLAVTSLIGAGIFLRNRPKENIFLSTATCSEGKIQNYVLPNDDSKVDSLKWVCVESISTRPGKNAPLVDSQYRIWYIGDKVYQMPSNECNITARKITTYDRQFRSRYFSGLHGFNLRYSDSNIPSDFVISNETAFFLGKTEHPFEPENLNHFIKEFYFPLYSMMKSTGNLNSWSRNVFRFDRPLNRCMSILKPLSVNQIKPFTDLLKIYDLQTSIYQETLKPSKICYKTAYFSSSKHLNHAQEAIDYVKSYFGLSSLRSNSTSKLVTFISGKTYTRVLNLDNLIQEAKSLGYDTKIAHLEDITYQEQAQLMHYTDILVGAGEANVQWVHFLKNYSGVIKIAWPQYESSSVFAVQVDKENPGRRSGKSVDIRPLSFATIESNKCHLNTAAVNEYHRILYGVESNFTKQQSLQILSDERNILHDDFTGRQLLCDVTVDADKFREALFKIAMCDFKKGREWS